MSHLEVRVNDRCARGVKVRHDWGEGGNQGVIIRIENNKMVLMTKMDCVQRRYKMWTGMTVLNGECQ